MSPAILRIWMSRQIPKSYRPKKKHKKATTLSIIITHSHLWHPKAPAIHKRIDSTGELIKRHFSSRRYKINPLRTAHKPEMIAQE